MRDTMHGSGEGSTSGSVNMQLLDYESFSQEELRAELKNLTKAIFLINQLALELDVNAAIENVRSVATELLECEKVTLFLVFGRVKELRGLLDMGIVVTSKFGEGIAGHVAETGELLNVADAYQHPLFNKEVDRQTGFKTRSLLCCAIRDAHGRRVAVLQAINKNNGQSFSKADEKNLKLFGTHLGNAIAKAKLYESARRERERLGSLHHHFKLLNAAGDLDHLMESVRKALAEVLSCENAHLFIKDNPRNELWTRVSVSPDREPMVARVRDGEGLVGQCLASHAAQRLVDYDGRDWLVNAIQDETSGRKVKSLMMQPVVATTRGGTEPKLLAVILAVNKVRKLTDKNSDLFFTEYFNQADADAAGLFALELGDVLAQRSLECALASAMSVMGADGSATGLSTSSSQHMLTGGSGKGGKAGGSVEDVSSSRLLQSQLMSMFLPVGPGGQGLSSLHNATWSLAHKSSYSSNSKSPPTRSRSLYQRPSLNLRRDVAREWGIEEDEEEDEEEAAADAVGSKDPSAQQGRAAIAHSLRASSAYTLSSAMLPEVRLGHVGRSEDDSLINLGREAASLMGPRHVTQSSPQHEELETDCFGSPNFTLQPSPTLPLGGGLSKSNTVESGLPSVNEEEGQSVMLLHGQNVGQRGRVTRIGSLYVSSTHGDYSSNHMFFGNDLLCSWDLDFTSWGNEELIKMCYDMFLLSGVMEHFELDLKLLSNFLSAAATHYHDDVPYHNFNHVMHVVHGVWMVIQTTAAGECLTMLDKLALMVAAVVHDLDHDGYSNSFHVNTGSELANIYNDTSVLENHHCALAFAMLRRKECGLLADLDPPLLLELRKTIIAVIMCTDMSNHFTLTLDFQKHSNTYDQENSADRLMLAKVILHACDIGNAVRPFHVNDVMSQRVHCEFQSQSDAETKLGLPVTFAVDKTDPLQRAQVEMNFLAYVVAPLWERLAEVLPELAPRYAQLSDNRQKYASLALSGGQLQDSSASASRLSPAPAGDEAGDEARVGQEDEREDDEEDKE